MTDSRHRGAPDAAADAPADDPTRSVPPADRPTATLVGDVPRLTVELIGAELEALKKEITARLVRAGVGVGLFAGAAFVGFLSLAVFLVAAVLGLALVLPGWLAALIVVVGLLIVVTVLVLVGLRSLRRGLHPEHADHADRSDRAEH